MGQRKNEAFNTSSQSMVQGEDRAGCELLISSGVIAESPGLIAWTYFVQL